mmetsp:Transcript_5693/g.8375  ORF Transcript_5693/g.8375 Transcript_5693/m.8375 type:complete len:196 (-) Transcript_5693:1843-2430(-)
MKFSAQAVTYTILTSLLTNNASAFAPATRLNSKKSANSARFMAMDMDAMPADNTPAVSVVQEQKPVVQRVGGAPGVVRYSEFLKMVDSDEIEKVTFSSDGTKLLGVDTDGGRIRIDALPNDPDLLNQLTKHKVDVTVLPADNGEGGLGALASSLVLPALLFGGLFFLSRRSGGGNMPGGMGGPGGPMGMGKSKAQ